jgi:hypothetical protein
LHSTKWSDGEKKKERKKHSSKKNSKEYLVGNEESRYPVPDPPKMINVCNTTSDAHKKILQTENHGRGH